MLAGADRGLLDELYALAQGERFAPAPPAGGFARADEALGLLRRLLALT